jgi:hypothetical protein
MNNFHFVQILNNKLKLVPSREFALLVGNATLAEFTVDKTGWFQGQF